MPITDPTHVDWCRMMWGMMKDGGAWGLPNSGLMFQKREAARELVLTMIMPHDPAMPLKRNELIIRQLKLYIQTLEHFAVLNIKVRRECDFPTEEV